MENYWDRRARAFLGEDLYRTVAPLDYNEISYRLWDTMQKKAIYRSIIVDSKVKVLDIGCGIGRWSIELAKRGAEVVGIDPSQEMIKLAIEEARSSGVKVEFKKIRMEEAEFPEKCFDTILALNTFYVVDNDSLHRILRNSIKCLKLGGTFVVLDYASIVSISNFSSIVLRSLKEWIDIFSKHSMQYVKTFSGEFNLLPNLYRKIIRRPAEWIIGEDIRASSHLDTFKLPEHSLAFSIHEKIVMILMIVSFPFGYLFAGTRFFRILADKRVMIFKKI